MTDGDTDRSSGADDSTVEGRSTTNWPASLEGVTETIVTTLGPNGSWNAAALGVFAGDPATARTWGNTRTRRNFHRRGEGYVQFTRDPVAFVEAALSIYELEEPTLDSADAWARVSVTAVDSGVEGETEWEEWELRPVESYVEREAVPTINRGFGAVIEATVAASRLGVAGYDDETLRDRLAYFESVVETAGRQRDRDAIEHVRRHATW